MVEDRMEHEVSAIVAEVAEPEQQEEAAPVADPRLEDLDRRIRELEAAIADLRTVSASAATTLGSGRKTQVSYAPQLLAKGAEPVRPAAVDDALSSLSVEQRLAVKSGLLRAGLL